MITFKADARFDQVEPATLRALADFHDLWMETFPDIPFVVTSGTDGTHTVGSFHGVGKAWDFRTAGLTVVQLPKLEWLSREFQRTHPGWQVLLEPDHGHVEHDGATH